MATALETLEGTFKLGWVKLRDGTLLLQTPDGKRADVSLTALEPIEEADVRDEPTPPRTSLTPPRRKRTFVARLNDGSGRWFRARMFRDEFGAEIIPVVGFKERPTQPPQEDDEEEIL